MIKLYLGTVGTIILTMVIFTAVGLGIYYFSAPMQTKIEYKTFKESQPFNEGMVRDLENLKMEYDKSDEAGKAALRSTIIHRFSAYDRSKLSGELQSFYHNLTGGY